MLKLFYTSSALLGHDSSYVCLALAGIIDVAHIKEDEGGAVIGADARQAAVGGPAVGSGERRGCGDGSASLEKGDGTRLT